jgi:hypothetical protein
MSFTRGGEMKLFLKMSVWQKKKQLTTTHEAVVNCAKHALTINIHEYDCDNIRGFSPSNMVQSYYMYGNYKSLNSEFIVVSYSLHPKL